MLKISCRTCVLLALSLSFAAAGVGQEKVPSSATNDKAATPAANDKAASFPTNEQMRHYKGMSDPQVSPDGKQVLVRIADATADGAKGHIWLVEVGAVRRGSLRFRPLATSAGSARAVDAGWAAFYFWRIGGAYEFTAAYAMGARRRCLI